MTEKNTEKERSELKKLPFRKSVPDVISAFHKRISLF